MRGQRGLVQPGDKFTRLTTISKTVISDRAAWLCKCECGTEKVILQQSLRSGTTKSCGCSWRDIMVPFAQKRAGELIGQKFGKWTVLSINIRRAKTGGIYFECKCECGTVRPVASSGLVQGHTRSCGCGMKQKFCKRGHDVELYGRTPTGSCKLCLKDKTLMRNYGITLEYYTRLLEFQQYKCAICRKPLNATITHPGFVRAELPNGHGRPELDHKHGGKKADKSMVRGILCGGRWAGCNRKLGRIDNIKWLESVIEYLRHPPAKKII